jgi:methionyl-tRNA synthetase
VFVPESATASSDGGRRVNVESGHSVEWVEEENYIFTPGRAEDKLLQWLEGEGEAPASGASGCVVTPKERLHEVKAMLLKGCPQVSVSRPAARLSWGIPVPDDASQTMYAPPCFPPLSALVTLTHACRRYVWVDALSSYLTGCKRAPGGAEARWNSTVHFIGKDILRFHAVLWPMFLTAAGLQPPSRIIAHGHWTVGKVKMSKSWGNVIDPVKLVHAVGVSAARYFMLREGGLLHDGEFDATLLLRRYNGELADTIGNLLSRCCALACKDGDHTVLLPSSFQAEDMRLMACVNHRLHEAALLFNDADFHKGLPLVFSAATDINKYLTVLQPWAVTKTDRQRALHIVYTALHCLRAVAALLSPMIPDAASQVRSCSRPPRHAPRAVTLSRLSYSPPSAPRCSCPASLSAA